MQNWENNKEPVSLCLVACSFYCRRYENSAQDNLSLGFEVFLCLARSTEKKYLVKFIIVDLIIVTKSSLYIAGRSGRVFEMRDGYSYLLQSLPLSFAGSGLGYFALLCYHQFILCWDIRFKAPIGNLSLTPGSASSCSQSLSFFFQDC